MLTKLYDDYEEFIDEKLDNVTEVLAAVFASGLSDKNAIIQTLQGLNLGLSSEFSNTLAQILAETKTTDENAGQQVDKQESAADQPTPAPTPPVPNTVVQPKPIEISEPNTTTPPAPAPAPSTSNTNTQTEAQQNKAAADSVKGLINLIGAVQLKKADSKAIDNARTAYDKLTKTQKGLVSNYSKLENAEATLKTKIVEYITKHAKKAPTNKKANDYKDVNKKIYNMNLTGKGKHNVLSTDDQKTLATKLGVTFDGYTASGNLYKRLKKAGISGFKVGSRNIPEDQLALLAEEGSELQFDKSQGVLRQIGKGDKIFTAEMTDKLWDIANSSNIGIPDSIKNMKVNVPNIIPMSQSVNNDVQLSIVLPGVQNYEQFKSELVRDKNFEKFVQQISIGSTLGNNSLTKYKF